ncbi:MAG: hypothetical protein ACRD6B_20730 [Bryobacteraceae bacterium]
MNWFRMWWRREEVRFYGTVVVFAAIVAVYAAILWFGHRPLPPDLRLPLFFRLHPERLLAMVAGVFGMFRVIRHVREERSLFGPLCWILFAGLVQLASVAIELGWF